MTLSEVDNFDDRSRHLADAGKIYDFDVCNEQICNEKNKKTTPLESSARILDEKIIPLLEERVIVDRHKRKSGEIVIRKVIETEIIEVVVRREKLIVEQVSPEYKELAVIDLGRTLVEETPSF